MCIRDSTDAPSPLTCEGTRTYTYTFTDCANNTATWSFVYTIDQPTFTIAAPAGALTVNCIADANGTTITVPVVTCLLYTSDASYARSSVDLCGRRIFK